MTSKNIFCLQFAYIPTYDLDLAMDSKGKTETLLTFRIEANEERITPLFVKIPNGKHEERGQGGERALKINVKDIKTCNK